MNVVIHAAAVSELTRLPRREQVSMYHAIEKLEALGDELGYPHSSAVKSGGGIRELRPRRGRSPWRALYARVDASLVILSIAPEVAVDPKGFRKALATGRARLDDLIGGGQ